MASVHVDGDFSVGTFTLDGAGTLHDANGKELERYTEGDNKGMYMDPAEAAQARFTVGDSGTPNEMGVIMNPFMVSVADDNTMLIPEANYSATANPTPENSQAAALASVSGEIGEIERDGTTVHLGYLTTYEGHNQRLVIVNRGSRAATYDVGNFVTEEGTMASAGDMASGEVKGMSSNVIQVRDLVSFEDGGTTRASATLSMDADESDVSVSTTLINTMDRSTDTVTYMPQ